MFKTPSSPMQKKHAGKWKFLVQFLQNYVNVNKNGSGMHNMLVPYNNTNNLITQLNVANLRTNEYFHTYILQS